MSDPRKLHPGWVGVLGGPDLWRRAPATLYIDELFAQAGLLNRRWIADAGELTPDRFGVAVIPDAGLLDEASAGAVVDYVESGGQLLVLGGPGPLAELFGVKQTGVAAHGWLEPAAKRWSAQQDYPMHVFDVPVLSAAGPIEASLWCSRAEGDPRRWPASARIRRGLGRALLISADIPGSIVRIQQGIAVERDGVPPADGSAPIDEGILKCDDAIMLDWDRDRRLVVPGLCPIFSRPQGDLLRGLLMTALAELADSAGVPLLTLDPWPNRLPAVGLISHDSDGHDGAGLTRQLETDAAAGVPACFCCMAGSDDGAVSEYSVEQLGRIAAAGHEIAFHYDAQTDHPSCRWGHGTFTAQLARLRDRLRAARVAEPVFSNKNHYTRWEGRLDFFRWLEAESIRVDQSKGPSKRGDLGWPFGTSHPWRPIDDEADPPRLMDLLEVSFTTQDLGHQTCPVEFGHHYIDAALAVGGVAHLLFHPAHTHRADVRQNVIDHVAYGRERGLAWWTSERIGRWQFARRAVTLADMAFDRGRVVLTLDAGEPLAGAAIESLGPARLASAPTDLAGPCEVALDPVSEK